MMKRRNDIKRLRQLVGLLLVALCMVACTTETYPGDSMAADKDEPMPIRLRMRPNINIGTEEEEWPIAGRPMTRATTYDSNSNSSLPTYDYGVFIIDEETYQNLVDRDASLAGYKTYGYVNEKAKLEGGELKREDGTYFVYPKAEKQATNAYIFVYWPYQDGLTLTELKDGIEVSVETTDQPSRLKNIDVLAGCIKVSTTNGFKDVSSLASSYPKLQMSHVMSHLTIAYVHTAAADETLSATLGNVHTKAKLNLFESLTSTSSELSTSPALSIEASGEKTTVDVATNHSAQLSSDRKQVTANFYALVPPQNIETSGANVTMTINGAPQSSRNFYPSNSENAPTAWAAGKKYKYNYTYVTGE